MNKFDFILFLLGLCIVGCSKFDSTALIDQLIVDGAENIKRIKHQDNNWDVSYQIKKAYPNPAISEEHQKKVLQNDGWRSCTSATPYWDDHWESMPSGKVRLVKQSAYYWIQETVLLIILMRYVSEPQENSISIPVTGEAQWVSLLQQDYGNDLPKVLRDFRVVCSL